MAANKQATIDALNRLLAIHYRSLPMYLADADPWTHPGDERAAAALKDIVESHRAISQRLAEEVLRRGGFVDTGEFPAEYTDLHFLSIDFLIRELIAALERDIEAIEDCVARLGHDPVAKTLAEEALGNARGHRQTLLELSNSVASGT